MHRYTVAKRLGDGTYGEVLRAVNRQSGEVSSTAYSFGMWHNIKAAGTHWVLRFVFVCGVLGERTKRILPGFLG